jgi:hypothetical protein
MKTSNETAKPLRLIALMLAASMLAACGGGESSEASSCNNPLLIIPCILTGTASAPPDTTTVSGSDSSPTAIAGPFTTSGAMATVANFDAFEPNNSFDNANILSIPFTSDGIVIGGDLTGSADDSDTFVFTPNRSGLHSIYLCADTCASAMENDQLSIMLLDQTQTTVESTAANGNSHLEIAADLTAGMAYYVQVGNASAGSESQGFSLVIVE